MFGQNRSLSSDRIDGSKRRRETRSSSGMIWGTRLFGGKMSQYRRRDQDSEKTLCGYLSARGIARFTYQMKQSWFDGHNAFHFGLIPDKHYVALSIWSDFRQSHSRRQAEQEL